MVGVGKTTLARHIAERLGFRLSLEKVDNNPFLEDYYRDFSRWSFHLQIYFLAERFKEHRRIQETHVGYVQDRTIYEDVEIFARLQYERGAMSTREYATYVGLFEAMTTFPYFKPPHLVICLRGNFEQILQRIHRRGRPMELAAPIDYWRSLYERYERWIDAFDKAKAIVVDIDAYDVYAPEGTEDLLQRIRQALAAQGTA
ncbi:MAG: deoxynucleoside kinase [Hydrogenibacillus sp.]|nr:deoxynucleoside kinase [Hydrogenibacillus sp.]